MDENKLDITIESLGLSERATNAFNRAGIKTLREFIYPDANGEGISLHLGRFSIEELLAKLKELGIEI